MNYLRFFPGYAVLLWALLAMNPSAPAATRKARPAPKEHAAKTVAPNRQEEFQKNIEQQIASLKEDVYTRATWKKLQEVKQQADDNAWTMKLVGLGGAGIGFALGVIAMVFFKRSGSSDDNLKIT